MLTAVSWLLLDRIGAPGWGWGVFFTLIALFWVGWFYSMFTVEFVDLFKQKEDTDHTKLEQILRRTTFYHPPNQKVQ